MSQSMQRAGASKRPVSLFVRFLKNWTLPVAIVTGFVAYEVYSHVSFFDPTRPYALRIVGEVQPLLIFTMLFLSFCKVDGRTLRPRLHHLWLLLIQAGAFIAGALVLRYCPAMHGSAVLQSCMLCMICPTATSACVVTMKLNGNASDITAYTVLVNLMVAVVVPLFVPLFSSVHGMSFLPAFTAIISRVFPMLIMPLVLAQLCRWLLPGVTRKLISVPNLPFYIWAVSLSIAIAVTARSLAHTHEPLTEIVGIAVGSLVCCALQFALGTLIGRHCGERISAAQSLGQKNTVFAIWVGYTFLNPISSVAGGFYSVWHNLYNTWQLRREAKRQGAC